MAAVGVCFPMNFNGLMSTAVGICLSMNTRISCAFGATLKCASMTGISAAKIILLRLRRWQHSSPFGLTLSIIKRPWALLGSLNLAHRDIKPANILRGPRGWKLADFGSIWLKGITSQTISAAGTEVYMSPEAIETMANPELLQRPFESDVFSLGMTMLHLASLKLPDRKRGMSNRELEKLLQREVQGLRYYGEFKRLLGTMLNIAPHERPALESIAEFCAPPSMEKANSLSEQGLSHYYNESYSKAIEMFAAAHAIYSRFPNNKHTAFNLRNWGVALGIMNRSEEAIAKFKEAQATYSRFPNDIQTAENLRNWGVALRKIGRSEEAVIKLQEAQAIYSRFPKNELTVENLSDLCVALEEMKRSEEAVAMLQKAYTTYLRFPEDKDTARSLMYWGISLREMGRGERAIAKFQEAQAIYSRFPNDKDTARSLMYWGATLCEMGRDEEAVVKLQEAQAIYSRFPNDKDTARSLVYWGLSLSKMKRGEEAVVKFQEAQAIYSRFPNDKDTARSLVYWGATLRNMDREEEAVAKYQEASTIYSLLGDSSGVEFCNFLINPPMLCSLL